MNNATRILRKWNIKRSTVIAAAFLVACLNVSMGSAQAYAADDLADGAQPVVIELQAVEWDGGNQGGDSDLGTSANTVAADDALESAASADHAASAESADASGATSDGAATSTNAANAASAANAVGETPLQGAAEETTVPADSTLVQETTVADGSVYTISASGDYVVRGSGNMAIAVSTTDEVRITLDNATIDATGTGHSAISMIKDAVVKLFVRGANELTGDENHAGIHVAEGADLTIEGNDVAESSLTAIGNAGIDYRTSAERSAARVSAGSGIGGTKASGASGLITVNGHHRNLTLSAIGGGEHAAGIGACGGDGSDITIRETNLVHVYGGNKNSEVGTNTDYAKTALEGNAAIGSGSKGHRCGTITIEDCYGYDIVGGGKSAGIGSGCWASDAVVNILNSDLTVQGGMTGSAIGAGRVDRDSVGIDVPVVVVNIADSNIVALGGYFGAGIGLGANGSNYKLGLSSITITNSTVSAYGGAGAAGIGGGMRGYNVSVTIDGGSSVAAYAGGAYQAKYITKWNGKAVTYEEKGVVQSDAAAIGRGAWGSVGFSKEADRGAFAEQNVKPALAISDDSMVAAVAPGGNWAIAGFEIVDGVDAAILQVRFSRNFDADYDTTRDFITRTVDEENLSRDVCFVDGQTKLVLKVRDANDSNRTLFTVELPSLADLAEKYPDLFANMKNGTFDNGWTGDGRYGYYAISFTVPGAGRYKIATDSDLRTMDRLGDEVIAEGEDGYKGGATHLLQNDREDVFNVGKGINNFDQGAFRVEADTYNYSVEYYFQENGVYSQIADSVDVRTSKDDGVMAAVRDSDRQVVLERYARAGQIASDADRADFLGRYMLDADYAGAQYEGVVAADGSLKLRLFFKPQFTVTYLDGVNGSVFASVLAESLDYGSATPLYEPPAREGYRFVSWDHQVTDTVTGDAVYVAQWEPITKPAEPTPEPEPEPATPNAPETEPVAPNAPDAPDAPEPAPGSEPSSSEAIPDDATPLAATPVAAAPAVLGGAVAAPVAPAAPAAPVQAIQDDVNPLAAESASESIEDDANPLSHGLDCWVHWWMMLGMALTALYSSVVLFRRKRNSDKHQDLDDSAMGKSASEDNAQSPSVSVKGTQPALGN